jgi:hypothetical protein
VVSKTKRRARTRLARVLGVVTAMGLGGIVSTSLQTHAEGPLPFNGPQLQPFGLPQPRPPFPYGLNGSSISPRALSPPNFDPASSTFFSLLSSEAMRTLAPNAFGNFVSATGPGRALSSAFGDSSKSAVAPMPALEGVDPDVAAMLNSSVSSITNASGASGATGTSGNMNGAGIVSSSAGINATGAVVGSSGGAYWTSQAVSATPVQFPPGVFAGMGSGNALGGLAPAGNPSNVVSQGPTGAWCVTGQTPFSESSPLESRVLWIGFIIVTGGVVVFLLSRGVHRPARSFERSSVLMDQNEVWSR